MLSVKLEIMRDMLRELHMRCSELEATAIASKTGAIMVSTIALTVLPGKFEQEKQICAMVGSIFAIGEAIFNSLDLGKIRYIVVDEKQKSLLITLLRPNTLVFMLTSLHANPEKIITELHSVFERFRVEE